MSIWGNQQMANEKMPKGLLETTALILIVMAGGVLRFWHITIGLPDLYVNDEIFEIHRALELLRGEYNFNRIKGMYFYLLALISHAYAASLILRGFFTDLNSFVSYSLVHPGEIVLLSRMTTACLGTFSIYLLYLLGKKIFTKDSLCPLLLALAWATCGLATWEAKWGLIETTLVFFGVLAFFPIINLLHDTSVKNYVLAGVFIAAATATKIYGVLLIAPLAFAHCVAHHQLSASDVVQRLFHRKLILAVLVFGISLFLFNPPIILHYLNVGLSQGVVPTGQSDVPEILPFSIYFNQLRWNLGGMGFLFLLVGLVVAIRRRKQTVATCAVFACVFFVALAFRKESTHIYTRYLLLSLPPFFIVAVYGFDVVRMKIMALFPSESTQKLASTTLVALVAIVMTWNGLSELLPRAVYGNTFSPVQGQVLRWFKNYAPPGSTVVMRGNSRPWPGNQTIPLFDLEENYWQKYKSEKRSGKTPAEIAFLVDLAQAENISRFNLILEDRHTTWKSPDAYVQMGAEYFVIDVEYFGGKAWAKWSLSATESRDNFYQLLHQSKGIELVKKFEGMTVLGAPRTIEIYQARKSIKKYAGGHGGGCG